MLTKGQVRMHKEGILTRRGFALLSGHASELAIAAGTLSSSASSGSSTPGGPR